MSGRRRLTAGKVRMLSNHRGSEGQIYSREWAVLMNGVEGAVSEGLRQAIARACWRKVRWAIARRDLEAKEEQRRRSRGRRVSEQQVRAYRRAEERADARYVAAVAAVRAQQLAEVRERGPMTVHELLGRRSLGEKEAR
jgi:hypothetical protein